MNKSYCIYILSSKRHGTLYIGSTDNLKKRIYQHKNKIVEGFTNTYSVDRLVYYEIYDDAESMVARERQLKKWNRAWKIQLIDEKNPYWKDLYNDL